MAEIQHAVACGQVERAEVERGDGDGTGDDGVEGLRETARTWGSLRGVIPGPGGAEFLEGLHSTICMPAQFRPLPRSLVRPLCSSRSVFLPSKRIMANVATSYAGNLPSV